MESNMIQLIKQLKYFILDFIMQENLQQNKNYFV